jgi:hypothetical protein
MKSLRISLITLFIVSLFAACKKDEAKPITVIVPDIPIYGTWTGTYTVSNGVQFYSLEVITAGKELKLLNANGTTAYSGGVWALNDTEFKGHYTPAGNSIIYIKAVFDSRNGTLKGKWGYIEDVPSNPSDPSYGGDVNLSKFTK